MEEIKDLILQYYKKYNTCINVSFHSCGTSSAIQAYQLSITGLDWNNTTIITSWDTDLKWLLGILIEKGPWCEELNHLYIPTRGYGIA